MANYSAIKAAVNAYIKQNGRKEITGRILNAVLNATIDSLGRFFQFAGGAMPTDDPGTPDQNVCYLAGEPGVYTNFGGITIENEEVALLFWNGEWTKQRILIGIREVNASVDNQVGTPSVDVNYSQGQLVLTFHNLKGNKGDTGNPAGFGTIGADINGGVGTPGVSVETSGDNTAKNLMFHFTNLKGETGVTSVVSTIDNTSGTPSCQVSLVNGVLTLAFSGLKGLKGDTGVSADYPITIYNGLDSDATDQALSAAQGKILDGKVSQLEAEVNGVSVSGANDTIARSDYVKVIPGHTYRCFLSNPSIARNNVSYTIEGYDILSIVSFTSGLVQVSVLFKVGANMKLVPYNDFYDIEIPAGADYIRYSIRANSGTTQMFWLEDITNISVNVDDAITGSKTRHIGFNLLDTSKAMLGYISKTDGRYNLLTSGVVYATDFIPVSTRGIYAYNGYAYGSAGGFAVYNSNKVYIRGNGSANPNDYTYQSGDAYIRFTYKSDNGYQLICEKPSGTITGTFNPAYYEENVNEFSGKQVFGKENIPSAIPAISQAGKGGKSVYAQSLSGAILSLTDWPIYIKGGQTITVTTKISTVGEIWVGLNRNSTTAGWFVRVTTTNISICKITGSNSYEERATQAHGLTLADFVTVIFEMGNFSPFKAKMMTSDGSFSIEYSAPVSDIYGQPFVEAVGSTELADVYLRGYCPKMRNPVWFIGDSYVSYYSQRWPVQMKEVFGNDNFLVDGLAGGTSEDMLQELARLLSFGTPTFLVWCLGMNDSWWKWRYCEKQVEMLCRANGIELILTTIPKPENGTKDEINTQVKDSGYRYIDVFSAVCKDTGEWYEGMCDDGVHPTVLGAKAIAARILADFPEITQ